MKVQYDIFSFDIPLALFNSNIRYEHGKIR